MSQTEILAEWVCVGREIGVNTLYSAAKPSVLLQSRLPKNGNI